MFFTVIVRWCGENTEHLASTKPIQWPCSCVGRSGCYGSHASTHGLGWLNVQGYKPVSYVYTVNVLKLSS